MLEFEGIPVSPGKVTGKAYVYGEKRGEKPRKEFKDVETEVNNLNKALEESKEEIRSLLGKASERYGEEKAKIFDAHLLLLEDPAFLDSIEEKIDKEGKPAPTAVELASAELKEKFRSSGSEYIEERSSDVDDVARRVISKLTGEKESEVDIEQESVILAEELLPSDTVRFPKDKILGFCTEKGSKTAHVSIIARSMNYPAVVGVDAWKRAEDGDEVTLDGNSGKVTLKK